VEPIERGVKIRKWAPAINADILLSVDLKQQAAPEYRGRIALGITFVAGNSAAWFV
jgi:hypothetical protein